MDDRAVVAPDFVPQEWAVPAPPTTCVCPMPVPEVRAVRKGAARTHCARCGLPVRIAFGPER
jgi:hypothetical protein